MTDHHWMVPERLVCPSVKQVKTLLVVHYDIPLTFVGLRYFLEGIRPR